MENICVDQIAPVVEESFFGKKTYCKPSKTLVHNYVQQKQRKLNCPDALIMLGIDLMYDKENVFFLVCFPQKGF